MADKEYFSFEEVLKNLKLEEDELKRLVSAGEIRAFRDKDTMRFKAEDVQGLKSDVGEELELEDLELDLDDDLELEESVAEEADDDAEMLVLEEEDAGEELVLEEAEPGGEDDLLEELDLGGDEIEEAAEPATRARGGRVAGAAGAKAGAAGKRARSAAAEPEEVGESAGMKVMLVLGVLILVVANFLVFDAVVGRASNALTRAVTNMFN